MTNTRIEAALQVISDGARLEQLVADILVAEGYDVEPTGKRGADGGRDAFLSMGDQEGILHCSVTKDWEQKIKSDVKKVEANFGNEEFDFFIFATNEDPATIKRDRVEEDITNNYNMRTVIYDFEKVRNSLLGNVSNHGLIREHLSVNPKSPFVDVEGEINEKHKQLLDRVASRETLDGPITEQAPLLAIHIISQEAIDESHDRFVEYIPEPPIFTNRGAMSDYRADYRSKESTEELDDGKVIYSCFHKDGWIEGINCNLASKYEHLGQNNDIRYDIDQSIVSFVEKGLEKFEMAGIAPPYYSYVTLIGFSDHTISRGTIPNGIFFAGGKTFDKELYTLNRTRFDSFDTDVPAKMCRSLNQIWQQTGWRFSQNYKQEENRNREYEYTWDPR